MADRQSRAKRSHARGAPFGGQRMVAARTVLVGEAAERRIARLEDLALALDRGDQLVPAEAVATFEAKRAALGFGLVEELIVDLVAVGRAEQAGRGKGVALPAVAELGEEPAGRELVAG